MILRAAIKKHIGRIASCGLSAALICTPFIPQVYARTAVHHRGHFNSPHRHTHPHTGQKPVAVSQLRIALPEGSIFAGTLSSPITSYPLTEWDGADATLEKMTQTIPALWGAVLMNGSQLETGCLQHWFHSLESPADCGMPAGTQTLALAWDRSRLTTAPDWQDFWDIARHPGRRGLYFGARTTLEITLLADGVAPESVYTLLSSPSGVERAFHKLDLLRPYIIWWRTPSDAHHIMQQRSALMTSAPLEEITPFSHVKTEPTFGTQMNHSLKISLFWAIPQNVSNDAEKNIINTIKTIDHFEKNTPTATVQNTLNVDDAFWKENGPALEKRFLNWFSRNTPQ